MALFDEPEFREHLAAMRQNWREQRATFADFHALLQAGLDSVPPTDPRYYIMRMTGSETAALVKLSAAYAERRYANYLASLNPRYGGQAPTLAPPQAE